ncbi:hypothetical protein MVUOKPPV_CDS0276 [Klebsiella phage phi1_175008]|uniref:Uncharacterized protein n=1 Tax=Klebsiella phage phi1_175008 TaxID=3127744 RepID=A0ACD5FSA3_9CAUD
MQGLNESLKLIVIQGLNVGENNLLYLKYKDQVIAFKDPDVFSMAKYAVTFEKNVYNRPGGGYTIFNHRTAKITDVQRRNMHEYMIGWYPTKDAASLFKLCKLIRGS